MYWQAPESPSMLAAYQHNYWYMIVGKKSLNNNMCIVQNRTWLVKFTFNLCLNMLTEENSLSNGGNLFHKVAASILVFLCPKVEWQLYTPIGYPSSILLSALIIEATLNCGPENSKVALQMLQM
jgi:hypothetical protein